MSQTRTLSQMYFLLTTISVIFMGMNCILFFFCVYVLWGQRSKSRRLLLFSSIVQFCLCLAQVSMCIVYLCTAYTLHADDAEAYFRHLASVALPCYVIYMLNNGIEGSLLIWRIYILYNRNIMICVPTIVLLALQEGFAGATAKGFATTNVDATREDIFDLLTWSLIVAVNVSATILISLRLWTAHRSALSVLSVSKYKSTIIVVVECGALVTVCTVAMLVVNAVRHPVTMAGLGITTQAATMAPLLIIARYGLVSRQDDRRVPTRIPLRISIIRTEDTRVDTPPLGFTPKHRLRADSLPMPMFPHRDQPKPFSDA